MEKLLTVEAEKPKKVVERGEFLFAAAGLDHGHIYGMCRGLEEAGGVCAAVWDRDPEKVTAFRKQFPGARAAGSLEELLEDRELHMIAGAAVPCDRCALGIRVMEAGKDYFCDKAPMTTLRQVEEARQCCERTGRKYFVYYGERVHSESAILAGMLLESGAIGELVEVTNLAPHRLRPETRPEWFWKRKESGGTICDIGSHQIEQLLFYSGCDSARVLSARLGNFSLPQYPEFDDFGAAELVTETGVSQHFRVDWLTPDGLGTWGDGRLFLLGTKGYIEARKYVDVAQSGERDTLILVDGRGEYRVSAAGKVGFPFFGQVILDSLRRTETAMTQRHAFAAAELAITAQNSAVRVRAPREK